MMGAWVPSEPPETDPETRSDAATIRLIKGRGFALTFSSHFAVAVIVGVIGWVYAEKQKGTVPEFSEDIRHMKEDISGLKSDFAQFKAMSTLQGQATERSLNELIARTANRRDP